MLRRDQSCELIAFQILQFVDKDNDSSIGLPCGAPNLFQQCRQVNLKIAIVGQPGLRRLTPCLWASHNLRKYSPGDCS